MFTYVRIILNNIFVQKTRQNEPKILRLLNLTNPAVFCVYLFHPQILVIS